jgi:large subunit ribosomal protein L22
MEVTHHTYNLRIAPRKMRLVIDQVRYMPATKAVALLALVPNRGAGIIRKSLLSAIQVAKDGNLDEASLIVQRTWCDQGTSLKRMVGASRGRMTRIMKKYSHLTIVLKGDTARKSRSRKTQMSEEPIKETGE